MDLLNLVIPGAVVVSPKASSKKQLLQLVSVHAGKISGLDERAIYEALWERERLGTTGVGGGIAIPHAKLDKLRTIFGLLIKLDTPVDFDALDEQPVDLVFALLAPESAGAEHLKALARVSRLLRDPLAVAKLRGAANADALYAVLSEYSQSRAA